mmetsp:Transcript_6418/g.20787  ORF Transcript_6418/g.20787 Transcript_6418/m.20787 type:complete len:590 (-) Transcript_6418:341-2110(-)
MSDGGAVALGVASALAVGAWSWRTVRAYARNDTPRKFLAVVLLAWFLGLSALAALLPLDLAIGQHAGGALLVLWKLNYWTTLLLSWVICPLLMEFWAAGEFSAKARLVAALRHNLRFYSVMACVLTAVAVMVAFKHGFSLSKVSGFLIAAANGYGMLLIMVMLGYGLVEVPREAWSKTDPKRLLRWHYCSAPFAESRLLDAQADLQEVISEVRNFPAPGSASEAHYDTVRALADEAAQECLGDIPNSGASAHRRAPLDPIAGGGTTSDGSLLDARRLSHLHFRLKKRAVRAQRAQYEVHHIVEQTGRLELLIERLEGTSSAYQRLDLANPLEEAEVVNSERLLAFTLRHRYTFWKAVSWFFAACSVIVLWNECISPFYSEASLFAQMVHSRPGPALVFLLTALPLVYMALCVYTALFKFKLLDAMALHGNRQTDVYCLLGNASYLGRLQFSLGMNYVTLLRSEDVRTRLAFHNLVGDMDIVPVLGNSFVYFLPLFIVLFGACTYFRIFDRVLETLGIETHPDVGQAHSSNSDELFAQGQQIITRFRNREERRAARLARNAARAGDVELESGDQHVRRTQAASFRAMTET